MDCKDLKEYIIKSEETLNYDFHATTQDIQVLLHGKEGLVTEVGELMEGIYNRKSSLNIDEELGDILWYLAIFMRKYPVLYDFMEVNNHNVNNIPFRGGLDPIIYTIELSIAVSYLVDNFKRLVFYGKLPKSFGGLPHNSDRSLLSTYEEEIIKNVKKIIELFMLITYSITTLQKVIDANRAKLFKRHGNSFNPTGVFNRDLEAEERAMQEAINKNENGKKG